MRSESLTRRPLQGLIRAQTWSLPDRSIVRSRVCMEEEHEKEQDQLTSTRPRISTGSAAILAPTKDTVDTDVTKTEQPDNEYIAGYEENHWWQRVPFLSREASPPTGTLDDATLSPEATAGWFSLLWWNWLTPIMVLGYSRPLEAVDLHRLPDDRAAQWIGNRILQSFQRRHQAAEEYNARLESGQISAGWRRIWWTLRGDAKKREERWRTKDGKKKASLTMAMNSAAIWWFWSGGVMKVTGDIAQMTSPLLVKEIIKFAQKSWAAHLAGTPVPPIGHGIGLCFALAIQQIFGSWCLHHSFYRAGTMGVILRAGLISAIYERSLHLTSRARVTLSNGRLINHISTDVSRIDYACMFFHIAWSSPICLIIVMVLLLVNLGPSALAGLAVLFVGSPLQTLVVKQLFNIRKRAMIWTDKRAKLLQELMSGMRVIKYFTWEMPFIERIAGYRKRELKYIRSLLLIRSGNNAVAYSLPALAAVVAFIVYNATGHQLDSAIIFTCLTLFQIVRMPLMWMPMGLSAIADAASAVERLYDVFVAEVLLDVRKIDPQLDAALKIQDATFIWDGSAPEEPTKKKKHRIGMSGRKKEADAPKLLPPEDAYKLDKLNLTIPRGQLCAIVGSIGSGKSSLLQGMIGEMRRTTGEVVFGGSVSYCPQSAWIQNATIRDNICFGKPFDETRYWEVIREACLEADLDMLPNGDLTEVGEKGITLSGGQRQRVNIARAIYFDSDIVILDDPLSALDAHVGKAVFNNVISGGLVNKTRILVTHALHFLPLVDRIVVMDNGKIVEDGTYGELVHAEGSFSYLVKQFGAQEEDAKKQNELELEEEVVEGDEEVVKKRRKMVQGSQQMQKEERSKGAVSGKVYAQYFAAAYGQILIPLLIFSAIFMQGAQVMSGYWLVYWQENKWHRPPGFYMAIYAALGIGQTLGTFMIGAILAFISFFASRSLHGAALKRVMHSPMSFFDTNPLGRIMNRFSKDIDTIDNTLADAIRLLSNTVIQIIGSVILIMIVLPEFTAPLVVIGILYYWMAIFYRHSTRELKRLDALLRSSLYSHFSESLYGLATIRAYGEIDRFRQENNKRMDVENRAYWLTVTTQRWLGIRLDMLGIVLTFFVAILATAARFSISPALTGLTLSYIVGVQQGFGWLVRQSAEMENDMNSAERILHYANELEQEALNQKPDSKPPPEWPQNGQIEIENLSLRYRPGLPIVLKGVNLSVRGGEKIGIIGRTGSGKSSLVSCMFRIVELTEGKISVDGVDISQLGLDDLRSKIAIIPQDPLLFSGTLRTNLDPFNRHDDALLNEVLRQSYLIDTQRSAISPTQSMSSETAGTATPINRFSLDTVIDAEGSNLSVGQRSLVSLARALVLDAKILALDEATASVDYLTDYQIGNTIARAFRDRTVLCIAHRLRTILSYDRVLVLDGGEISELDTPENLYKNASGIFRMMCERSSITMDDIKQARREREDLLAQP